MNKHILLIILLSSIFIFIAIFSVIFSILNMNNSTIFSGIYINDINVSGMTKEELNNMFSKIISEKTSNQLNLSYNDTTYSLNFSDINLHYNLNKTIDDAYNYGREGNIVQNNYSILSAMLFKKNYYIDVSFDKDSLNQIISDISSKLSDKLIQTSYYIEDGNLIITKGTSGTVISEKEFTDNLYNFLNNFSNTYTFTLPVTTVEPKSIDINKIHSEIYKEAKDAYYEKDPIKIYPEIIGVDFDIERASQFISKDASAKEYVIQLNYTYPKVKIENLDINIFPDLLASFSTKYDASNKDRSTNLQLAAEKINDIVLSPNEQFSYNKIVGERSIAAGYKEAKVYSNGQVVDGIGGGICQISSTLYNSAVFANLQIDERYNHQFVSSYISPGRDATVVYGAKDLKFTNTRTYPIKILVSVNSGVAKVDIYGLKEENEYEIGFETDIISTIDYNIKYEKDSSLSEFEEKVKQIGANGMVVDVYKILKKNGIPISKQFISKDSYKSLDKIIVNKEGKEQ